jgi:hypothetical protein
MATTQKFKDLPPIIDLTGAKIIGLDALGNDAQFTLDSIVRSQKGIAFPSTLSTGTRFAGETWIVDTGSYGSAFPNFGGLTVPVKVGAQYVSNARFVYNAGAWTLQRELVDTPALTLSGSNLYSLSGDVTGHVIAYGTGADFTDASGSVSAIITVEANKDYTLSGRVDIAGMKGLKWLKADGSLISVSPTSTTTEVGFLNGVIRSPLLAAGVQFTTKRAGSGNPSLITFSATDVNILTVGGVPVENVSSKVRAQAIQIDQLTSQTAGYSGTIAAQQTIINSLTALSQGYSDKFAAILNNQPDLLKEKIRLQILVDGDSLDFGQGASATAFKWPNVAAADLGNIYYGDFSNFGVAGQTVTQMLSDEFTQVIPTKNTSDYDATVLVVGGGINELMNGTSAADVYAKQKQYHANARTSGISTVVQTLTVNKKAYGIGVTAGETARLQYNALIRSGVASGDFGAGAILVDLGADPRIGVYETADSTIFNADLQHLNDAGYNYKAKLIEVALTSKALMVFLKSPVVSVVITSMSVRLNWSKIKNALAYSVSRSLTDDVTTAIEIGTTLTLEYIDGTVAAETTYFYFIKATGSNVYSSLPTRSTATTIVAQTDFTFDPTVGFNITNGTWNDSEDKGLIATPIGVNKPAFVAAQINGLPVVRFNKSAIKTRILSALTGNAKYSMIAVVKLLSADGTGSNANNANLIGLGDQLYYTTNPAAGSFADLIYFGGGKLTLDLGGSLPANTVKNPLSYQIVGVFFDGTSVTFYNADGIVTATSSAAYVRNFNGLLDFRIGGGHYDSASAMLEKFSADYATVNINVSQTQTVANFTAKIAAFKTKFGL